MKSSAPMRPKASRRLAAAACVTFAGAAPTLRDANLYWDTNGATAGASGGTIAAGTWDGVTANWSSDSSGASATGVWSNGSVAVFAAGANATGIYSVTVSGTQTLGTVSPDAAIIFQEGNVTLNGGTLNMVTGLMTVGTNLTATINSTLDGSVGPGTTVFGKDGAGALVLGGANTFTGRIDLFAGLIAISSDANLGNSSNDFRFLGNSALDTSASFSTARNFDLLADGMLIQDTGTNLTVSGVISGTGSLTKTGAGTLTLTNVNTFTGGTTISAGTLVTDTGINRIAGAVTVAGGTLDIGIWDLTNVSTLTLSSGSITASVGVITASSMDFRSGSASVRLAENGTFTKNTTGTVTLTGANSYTGGTVINDGTLSISADQNLGDSAGSVTFAGGTLSISAAFPTSRAITLNGTGGTISVFSGTVMASGVISGTGALSKKGGATLRLNVSNTYTGRTNVDAGTLTLGTNAALADASAVTIAAGASLSLAGVSDTIGSLSGPGAVQLGAGALTVGADNTSTTYSGVMSGAGALAKIGSGTLTLSGTNTYVGGTSFLGGIVSIAAVANARAPYTFDGGTLRITASLTASLATTLNAGGGILDISAGQACGNTGVIAGGGVLTKAGGGALVLSNTNNTYSGGTTFNAGTLQVSADSNLGGVAGNLTLNGGTLSTTASFSTSRNVTVNSSGGTVNVFAGNLTFAGTVGGNGGLTKNGAGTLVINSVQSWTSGVASLTVNAGPVALNTNAGGSGRALNVNASGGGVTFNASQTLDQLAVGFGQTATLSANGSRFIDTPVLTIAGSTNAWTGKLDLTDNDLIVRHSAGQGPATLAQIRNQLKTALNQSGTLWNGNGITSSAAAVDPSHLLGLAVASNNDLGLTDFAGRTVDANTILVKYTYFGDGDLNGRIDIDDFVIFDVAIFGAPAGGGWVGGDYNYDGVCDRDNDFAILIDAFHNQGAPMTPQIQAVIDHINAVPEPSGAGVAMSMAVVGAMARRRRRATAARRRA